MRILLAINPSITQCLIQGLAVSDRCFAGILFENAQQDALRLAMVFRKPGPEITRRCEAHYFHHSYSRSTSATKTRDCWAPFHFIPSNGSLNEPKLEAGVIAADIMDEDFPRISRLQGIGEAFEMFSTTQTEQLPVVDHLGSQRLIGSLSKTDIILHIASKEGSKT